MKTMNFTYNSWATVSLEAWKPRIIPLSHTLLPATWLTPWWIPILFHYVRSALATTLLYQKDSYLIFSKCHQIGFFFFRWFNSTWTYNVITWVQNRSLNQKGTFYYLKLLCIWVSTGHLNPPVTYTDSLISAFPTIQTLSPCLILMCKSSQRQWLPLMYTWEKFKNILEKIYCVIHLLPQFTLHQISASWNSILL